MGETSFCKMLQKPHKEDFISTLLNALEVSYDEERGSIYISNWNFINNLTRAVSGKQLGSISQLDWTEEKTGGEKT